MTQIHTHLGDLKELDDNGATDMQVTDIQCNLNTQDLERIGRIVLTFSLPGKPMEKREAGRKSWRDYFRNRDNYMQKLQSIAGWTTDTLKGSYILENSPIEADPITRNTTRAFIMMAPDGSTQESVLQDVKAACEVARHHFARTRFNAPDAEYLGPP